MSTVAALLGQGIAVGILGYVSFMSVMRVVQLRYERACRRLGHDEAGGACLRCGRDLWQESR